MGICFYEGSPEEVASRLAGRIGPGGLALLVGAVDVGKTTLARALSRELGGEVVDADLGQSAIGPPTAVTLGTYEGGMRDGYFVGDTTPRGHLLAAACGAKLMAQAAQRPTVVDTDGFIAGGAGRAYKLSLLELLQPDLLVLIPKGHELDFLIPAYPEERIVSVRLSGVRGKSREARTQARERAFREALSRCGTCSVPWDGVRIRGSLLGVGEVLRRDELSKMLGCEVLFARRLGREAAAVVGGYPVSLEAVRHFLGLEELHVVPLERLEGRIIGCYRGGRFAGIGRVEGISAEGLRLSVPEGERPEAISFGFLQISPEGKELRRSAVP